jgi:hypothetical protein
MPPQLPALFSVVVVARNLGPALEQELRSLSALLAVTSTDHELIVVDNASTDDSLARLRELAGAQGIPNFQVYCLAKETDFDSAAWAGLENALGDFVAVYDPLNEDPAILPSMLELAARGADVVFAENLDKTGRPLWHRAASAVFHSVYRRLTDVHLGQDAPRFRILSRRILNYVARHPVPALSYRHLPATCGFQKANLSYRARPRGRGRTGAFQGLDRAMRTLVSSTRAPMRLVTALCTFGAAANVLYSVYVIGVAIFRSDVAPGWVTLSLQQSGMFFLLSLVLLVLGEYVLHMAALSSEGPPYHVAQEFTGAIHTRRSRLNVEDAGHAEETRRRASTSVAPAPAAAA